MICKEDKVLGNYIKCYPKLHHHLSELVSSSHMSTFSKENEFHLFIYYVVMIFYGAFSTDSRLDLLEVAGLVC